MTKPITFEKIEVSLTTEMKASQGKAASDDPFHILILGDFRGRTYREMEDSGDPLTTRHPLPIDRDNFDDVMARLIGELSVGPLESHQHPFLMKIKELEDFHPDQIAEGSDIFQRLLKLRTQLTNPSTFKTAAAEIRAWFPQEREEETSPPTQETGETWSEHPSPASAKQLLEQILEGSEDKPMTSKEIQQPKEWQKFLERIVAPHLIPKMDPDQPELLAQVDAAIGAEMKKVLHHPLVQELEAAWQGLFFLVMNLQTDTKLKIFILDISKAELARDLCETEDVGTTALFHHLVESTIGTPGGEPWAAIGGLYTFDSSDEDVQLLGRLAKVAAQAQAPFMSGASPHIIGSQPLSQTPDPSDWDRPITLETAHSFNALREQPEARYLGLALPRFLLRLPYGKETTPIRSFEFEEMSHPPTHEHYLWGNPIFACLYILGESYSAGGWESRPRTFQEIEGLPLHLFKSDGETQIKPCAEVLLTDRAIEAILDQGLIPIVSVKNRDVICVARMQSVANPLQPLAGRWDAG